MEVLNIIYGRNWFEESEKNCRSWKVLKLQKCDWRFEFDDLCKNCWWENFNHKYRIEPSKRFSLLLKLDNS